MTPRLITRQHLAAAAAVRWADQYRSHLGSGDDKDLIHKSLVALGPNPAPDDVDAAIGNRSWTHTACDACEKRGLYYAGPVVEVGAKPDYESATARLCFSCLSAAVAVALGAR